MKALLRGVDLAHEGGVDSNPDTLGQTLRSCGGILRLLLAAAFVFMGVTHFLPSVQRTMASMIPPRLRFGGVANPRNLVIFTGLCEIFGGLGLLYPPTIVAAGVCLIVFLVAVFPANAYAASHPERFGKVATPLVPRLIGQLVLIALVIIVIWSA